MATARILLQVCTDCIWCLSLYSPTSYSRNVDFLADGVLERANQWKGGMGGGGVYWKFEKFKSLNCCDASYINVASFAPRRLVFTSILTFVRPSLEKIIFPQLNPIGRLTRMLTFLPISISRNTLVVLHVFVRSENREGGVKALRIRLTMLRIILRSRCEIVTTVESHDSQNLDPQNLPHNMPFFSLYLH